MDIYAPLTCGAAFGGGNANRGACFFDVRTNACTIIAPSGDFCAERTLSREETGHYANKTRGRPSVVTKGGPFVDQTLGITKV